MPSVRVIAAYFGPHPAYLPLVLRSMGANADIDWLLFTDRPVGRAPANVSVQLVAFAELSARIRAALGVDVCLERPYKLCDYRPAFGEIFADELAGYDFWGHCDLDVLFGRIRDHLPPAAFEADKILFQGNFALYRNTAEAARWYRHEVGKVSYRHAFARPAAMHFDEWAGIYYILRDLGVRCWHENVIFDLAFAQYRTRALSAASRGPRRYAWEDGEVAEYRVERGHVRRRTALLIHFQKRTLRPPSAQVLAADRYWVNANGFTVQGQVTPWTVLAAHVPAGHEIGPHYWRRLRRWTRRQRAHRAAARGEHLVWS